MLVNALYSDGPDRLCQKLPADSLKVASGSGPVARLRVDAQSRYQIVDGFGASFTDSAAYLVDQRLDEATRARVMRDLFDPDQGIGLSLLRNPMGACDYARSIYSYDDTPLGQDDMSLLHFSIEHDLESIVPLTKQAMELNPRLKLIASPWSPPGWMKTSDSMVTGSLRVDCYPVYAQYFVRFAQEYEAAGLPVYAFTVQNEPLFVPLNYPGCFLPADQEALFVHDFLRPALRSAGLDTLILGYDHNWDRIDYPLDLLDQAGQDFDGIAWHWYGGRPVSQSRLSLCKPGSDQYFTEGSGGDWIPAFEPAFSNLMRTGIEILQEGSKTLILWNIALDEDKGPVVPGFGQSTCRGLVDVNQSEGTAQYSLDYYGLAHFSEYVRPGAQRIGVSESAGTKAVAFENEDHSQVVVVFNDSERREVKVSFPSLGEEVVGLTMEPHSAATIAARA
ncbi:hypothetical protein KIM372_12570 [Bombiscardovia nodaiensis]|uniref:Glycosyl hydrolase n=1 Tax=Bombiscardovia nodaiensis TaxID=2932181 RepID=A0ABN6SF03_9BIFI|nr:hypothetical protein KIM372_12570 [Bombiscardovia nodaiensis]